MIGKRATLQQVEKVLRRKNLQSRIKQQGGYYFLKGRKGLVKKRLEREKNSAKLMRQAVLVAGVLKAVPTIKLVGVSGNLAMENATSKDDIDFFIITQKGKLWISRMAVLLILNCMGKRRDRLDKNPAGKICVNLLLEEDQLFQENRDLYTAHEVLQMKVLWQRDNIYSQFLEENEWAFTFLPNWTSSVRITKSVRRITRHSHARESNSLRSNRDSLRVRTSSLMVWIEIMTRFLQLRYMGAPSGKERVSEHALYFHPHDYREKILKEYQGRLVSRP